MASNGAALGARHDAALVALAVLVATSLLVAGADAGRWSHKHHRHHPHRGHPSPPAPPGFDQPMAAPSPTVLGDGPVASPFTQRWSHSRVFRGEGPPPPCDGVPAAAPSLQSGFY